MKLFPQLKSRTVSKYATRSLVAIAGLWFGLDLSARLGAELLWFQEVGYLRMYLLRLTAQGVLWLVTFALSLGYLFGNLALAQRLKYAYPKERDLLLIERSPASTLRLRWLLFFVLGLSLLAGTILLHYGQALFGQWHPALDRPTVSPSMPSLLRPETLWHLGVQSVSQGWIAIALLGSAIAVLRFPRFWLAATSIALSGLVSVTLSRQWVRVLQSLHAVPFDRTEPVFNQNISFYIFSLPAWELLEFWLVGVLLYAWIAATLTYLLSGDSLSQGKFAGFSPAQGRHLCGLGSGFLLAVGLSFWLGRYQLLYSSRGVAYGASFTDLAVLLPAYTGLAVLTWAIAIGLFWQSIRRGSKPLTAKSMLYGAGIYLGSIGISIAILPMAVQSFLVQPNELAREQPYLQRTIAFTRQAFGLENIETQTFNPAGQLTYADIEANDLAIRNIRLWDQQPLLETNRQLQQIRLYYRFPDADIDRYTLQVESPSNPASKATAAGTPRPQPPTAESQQVLISARELDYSAVPKEAQTWVNQRMIYTHGYGFTLSPVNRASPEGLPEYLVKDIGVTEGTPLTTSSPAVRASIPIGQPRIYYGELSNTYVMTGTKVKELDYPSGDENVYNIYDGQGGISVASPWRKFLFAKYLNDWRMLLTPEFTPNTKLLFRRNINQRIRAIAPFLRYDSDPYLVAANATPDRPNNPSRLFWIVDAYTTSDRYPYSDGGSNSLNYIRNSVKVVVDAYHGSVAFYIADPSDPVIDRWTTIFPDLFQPLSAMPTALRQHLRYPVDFLKLQSERLMTYHMTDAQVFYNREDQWQIPTEIYGDKPRGVEPYYLITSLPGVQTEEFILLRPFTPKERSNLVAWLAARSDGENYGKLLLYTFPKQRLVYGPEQIEARINQDPVISQQISLWNRQGSRAIQGNLLIIPIEQSLLYVEPLYLEATQNKLPILARVIVAYENRIAMAQTLNQALQAVFKVKETPVAPPIVRSVDEAIAP
ncbi:UPF0182 family protein [Altericista sp. CCNU0014]|uniref:UPF0182 family protein n=1 Tax=Altericista sp. CCNU0014 TaxID=3082949 RepID=UPI003850C1BE